MKYHVNTATANASRPPERRAHLRRRLAPDAAERPPGTSVPRRGSGGRP
jgi:hypothetical protein